jgi:S1-C subfamily serine protease
MCRHWAGWLFPIAVVAMCAAASECWAGSRSVAVLHPRAGTGTVVDQDWLAERIRDAVMEALPPAGFDVMSEEELRESLRGAPLACLQESCELEVGARLAVDLLVAGDVSEARGRTTLRLRLYEVFRDTRLAQVKVEAASVDALVTTWRSEVSRLMESALVNADEGVANRQRPDSGARAHDMPVTNGKGESPANAMSDAIPGRDTLTAAPAAAELDGGGTTSGNPRSDTPTGPISGGPKPGPPPIIRGLDKFQPAIKSERTKSSGTGVRGSVDDPSKNGLSKASEESSSEQDPAPGNRAAQTAGGESRREGTTTGNPRTDTPNDPLARTGSGTGTGFALSSRLIITNAHVVGNANLVSIVDQTGGLRTAVVIGRDSTQDLAVLELMKREPSLTSHLVLARAAVGEFAKAGQRIFVLGYPLPTMLGKDIVITEGIVNSRSGMQGDSTFFQMSVPIQPGNSGSPVLSDRGHVVGIVSSSLRSTGLLEKKGVVAQNVNFAIKSNMLVEVFPWLLRKVPGSEVQQSYFEHMSTPEDESGGATEAQSTLTAEEIVSRCASSVVRIIPLKP